MFRLLIIGIIAIVFAPTLYRAIQISKTVETVTGQETTAFFEVFRNDLPLIATVLGLLILTAALRTRWIACLTFAGAALIQLALMSDILVYRQFSQRLAWSDVLKFSDYTVSYLLDFDLRILVLMLVSAVFFGLLCYMFFLTMRRVDLRVMRASGLLGILALTTTSVWQDRQIQYTHYRFYLNFLSYNNVVASEFQDYATTTPVAAETTCTAHPTLSGPVIMYMVESLSSYQTRFFGGVHDWMPHLDRIARQNAALTRFHANGFTTEDGELSLLTSELPLYPPKSFTTGGSTAFAGYWNPERTLPRLFNARDYDSYFLTSADLSFSSTGDWARTIGFETVEGSTHPFYDNMQRFHFDAAGDAALVDHVLQTLSLAQKPPFIFVKTVSSHHPHIHPETGERSVEAVMRYTDAQIGRLHDTLQARGFFETGHLVIVGDHRAMLPLTRNEVETFGPDRAYTQVPAVIVSQQIAPAPVIIDTPYSQADLGNTLMGLFGGQMCHGPFKGTIWGDNPQPAQHILHRRGDWRHQVSVFSGAQHGIVVLKGDDTHYVGEALDPAAEARIVDHINTARITAGQFRQGRLAP